jgi:hypothetical protein
MKLVFESFIEYSILTPLELQFEKNKNKFAMAKMTSTHVE